MSKKYISAMNPKALRRIQQLKSDLEEADGLRAIYKSALNKIVQMDKDIDNPKVHFPGWQDYWQQAVKIARKALK